MENQKTPEAATFKSWVEIIRSHRLTTYDLAGNLFVDGGIPHGFDVVGFDFYISTLLLDTVHNGTMDWLAIRFPDGPCRQFKGQNMRQIRAQLSFFGAGGEGAEQAQARDRRLLDDLFDCRMPAMLQLLRENITASGREMSIFCWLASRATTA